MLVFNRKELYKRNDVQKLFKAFKEGGVKRIEPEFRLEGGLRYPDAEKIMDVQREQIKPVLEELAEDEILVKELLETRITCPKCGSFKASLRLGCTACGSPSLKKGAAIEHSGCGYVDFETVFKTPNGSMTCPRCNTVLKSEDGDYRKLGAVYKCLVCGEFSKTPKRILICGECGYSYNEEEGVPFEIYGFFVNDDKREAVEIESLDLSPVIRRLRASFWDGKTSVVLKGSSGIEHPFTLVAYRPGEEKTGNETNIIVDIVFDENIVDEASVISLFSKVLDFNVKQTVLIGISSVSEDAKKLAESYRIRVFECGRIEDAVETLWKVVKPIVEEEASKTFMEVAGILETSQALKGLIRDETQDLTQSNDIY